MVLYIVGTDYHADIILKTEVFDKYLQCGASTTAADSQLQPTIMQGVEGLQYMREEGDGAGVVVIVENPPIGIGTLFCHDVVDRSQLDETLLQRQSYDRLALGIATRWQVHLRKGAVQCAEDERLSVRQRPIEVKYDQVCHFWAAKYCSSSRWTYLPKTSNSMFTTVPGLKLWKLVT